MNESIEIKSDYPEKMSTDDILKELGVLKGLIESKTNRRNILAKELKSRLDKVGATSNLFGVDKYGE